MNLLKQNGGILKDMNVLLSSVIENGGHKLWKKFMLFSKEVEYYKTNGTKELKQKINNNKPYGNKPFDISSVDECLL